MMRSTMTKEVVKRPLLELLEELKVKINLSEGDRRAYYECSYLTMQANRDKIGALRRELVEMRKCLWEKIHGDITIISQAFQNRPVEKSAFSGKTARMAIEEMDYRVSDAMKRFNHCKFITESKQKYLQSLIADFNRCTEEKKINEAEEERFDKLPDMQHIRLMENNYEKLQLKFNECEYIEQTYRQIYDRLYDEQAKANGTLDELESDIRRCRAEKRDLIVIHNDAIRIRDETVSELQRLEEFVYADRKRRDIEVLRMRKVSDEHKLENERAEKKVAFQTTEGSDGGTEAGFSGDTGATSSGSPERSDHSFEENYTRLRIVTGIPDVRDVVNKFESQLFVKHNLITLINKMETRINDGRESRTEKQNQLTALKSRVDSHTFEVQSKMDNKRQEVGVRGEEANKINEELTKLVKIISVAKFGLEHMMEKLMHIKVKERCTTVVKPATTEEYIQDLFNRMRLKIRQLLQDLQNHDINEFYKRMNDEQKFLFVLDSELESSLMKQVPMYNVRLLEEKYKESQEGEDESGEDDGDWKSRDVMKNLSMDFIESKTRKKSRRKVTKQKKVTK